MQDRRAFADHHAYTPAELAALRDSAARQRAQLVTTAKDWVRLDEGARRAIVQVGVTLAFDPPDAAMALLTPLLAPRRGERAHG